MKNLLMVLALAFSIQGFAQTAQKQAIKNDVPAELITNDSTYWMISTLSGVNYVNTTPRRLL